MKQKLLFLAVLCSTSMAGMAQTNVFPANGNVGIGTTSPNKKLDVVGGDINIYGTKYSTSGDRARLYLGDYNANIAAVYDYGLYFSPANLDGAMVIRQSGNVGIGTTSPNKKLDVVGGDINIYGTKYSTSGDRARLYLGDYNAILAAVYDYGLYFSPANLDGAMVIRQSGNVGIGTTTPDQKLTVKGKIHAEEVIVDLNVPVADYVFAKDYALMPLHKVEQYVQQNSHLPDIPSASEIKEQGLSMGEMQNKLLKKIEELTLYAIEQNKKMESQQQEIQELKAEIKQIKR
jgi:hypothetical protein